MKKAKKMIGLLAAVASFMLSSCYASQQDHAESNKKTPASSPQSQQKVKVFHWPKDMGRGMEVKISKWVNDPKEKKKIIHGEMINKKDGSIDIVYHYILIN
jgi:PBP1b-binding outer membrane lipoprotein LpoB